jgi:putative salt-induced outer membrane protein YdiY
MVSPRLVVIFALALSARCALAQAPGERVDASLSSGDVVRGRFVSEDDKNVIIQHPVLGKLVISKKDLKGMTTVPPEAAPPPTPVAPAAKSEPASVPPAVAAASTPAPPPAVTPDPESFWEGWKGGLELGVNGSEGNSQALSVRGAVNLKRETSKTVTTAGLLYTYSTSDGDKTLDHGEINLRNDWKIGSPWRIYATGKAEYDTFQDWVWRTSLFAGVGYEIIKSDNTLLLGRVGAGVTKEYGSSKQRIEPELDLGLDWEHKIDERQKIFATIDYYPSLHRFTTYRVDAKAGYEIIVDPTNKLALKLGLEDRYNSNPGDDKKKNDLLYFATIVYTF